MQILVNFFLISISLKLWRHVLRKIDNLVYLYLFMTSNKWRHVSYIFAFKVNYPQNFHDLPIKVNIYKIAFLIGSKKLETKTERMNNAISMTLNKNKKKSWYFAIWSLGKGNEKVRSRLFWNEILEKKKYSISFECSVQPWLLNSWY